MKTVYERDAIRLRTLAQEVIRQVGFFQRNQANGSDDTMRLLLIHTDILKMERIAARADRRWNREWEKRKAEQTPEVKQ